MKKLHISLKDEELEYLDEMIQYYEKMFNKNIATKGIKVSYSGMIGSCIQLMYKNDFKYIKQNP